MKYAEDRVLHDGVVIGNDILKVNSFVNEQVDTEFVEKVADYFAKEFPVVDKILTIEASGISFAVVTGIKLGNKPVIIARKSKSKIIDPNRVYSAKIVSFTRGIESEVTITKDFLKEGEKVLIIDDFLASGAAGLGLVDMCKQAKADIVGFATVVEKTFQGGREKLEALGLKVVSAAAVKSFKDGKPVF